MEPFREMPLAPTGLLCRLLRRPNKRNACIELNNLLARSTTAEDVGIEDIAALESKYRVVLPRRFHEEVARCYETCVKECLADKKLSDADVVSLVHLKIVLRLTDGEAVDIENKVKADLYGASIDQALADGQMTNEEYEFLNTPQSEIRLPEEVATSIYREKGGALLQQVFNRAVEDRRLSPAEEAELQALSNNLHITMHHDEKTQRWLEKFRLLWRIENADLPAAECSLSLPRTETCHLSCAAQWYESRRVARRISYGGPALRIKIAKGLYWRAGSYGINVQRDDVTQVIDTGTLYLTNKRLIFVGARGNKTIPLNKILDFESYTDGVKIQKTSGKNPLIQFTGDGEIFAAVLGRVIRDVCAT
jgi:hypothetical protein